MMKKWVQSFLASPKKRERESWRCGWKANGLDSMETTKIEFDWNGMDEEEHKKLPLWMKGKWNGMDWTDDDGPCVVGVDGREGKISVETREERKRENII